MIGKGGLRRIHHDQDNTPILVDKSRALQLRTVSAGGYPFGAGMDEPGKMPDIIISIRIDQFPRPGIPMHRSKTKITNMIGPPILIQQNIPIRPADTAVVEIVDHRIAIAFSQRPVPQAVKVELLLAPL